MRLTVLGCSGSVGGPDAAASGYLLTAPDTRPLAIDFGPGVLGALQNHLDPSTVSILLSHLHADHCLDLPGLLVWRRYGPSAVSERTTLFGPAGTAHRIGAASAEIPGEIDDVSDTFDVRDLADESTFRWGTVRIDARRVCHPPEAYGFRITSDTGGLLVYTGDTAYCDEVVALADGADVLLSEASWTHAPDIRPPGIHLSGIDAGRIAARAGVRRLLLAHIPPWTSRDAVLAEARSEFDGEVVAVRAGDVYDIG